ncbi:MAG: Stk1 family PASTA domain-containing Ser/Thr kinase [Oscillospiraceae bacterium]|nr:Stk1 family PASTA domain-containing Ser/Thr kinase [Oscillospiraceae bacterium]
MNDKYIGKLLDNRYEILQVIGTGGMAVVYKALCHRLNRHVAVKILKDEYAKDEEFRNRFHAESHAVAMLSHPNIVAVYDVSRSNSIEYIVMELMDGMTLKQYMERRGTLSQKESVHFITQILKALSHAHSKGIIHRDIKPHNIMLLRDSTVKVADFGIARLESSQRTVTREAFGSVHYIAPEQAKGSHIDCRADIYSTGVVLYEMLTGRLPYEGDTPVSVAIQHINSLPLSPREINPDIPEALEKITMKAMAPSLAKRYASTDEMLADLEEYRKNPQVNIEYEPPVKNPEDDTEATRKLVIPSVDEVEDEPEEKSPLKAKMPLIATAVAATVFLVGLLTLLSALFGWGDKKPQEKVETPNVLGMTIEDAAERYPEFEIIETNEDTREYSDEYDEGEIVKQRPREDEVTSSGKIYVTISKGKRTDSVELTDLTNMSEEQAKILLDRKGLQYRIETENSEEIEAGNVIKTEPSAGDSVSTDEVVTLYVSLGSVNKKVTVPNLLGLTENKAIESLVTSKLQKGKITYENSSTTEKGIVISQKIASGEPQDEGTAIDFSVSLGPKKAETPSTDDKPVQNEDKNDVPAVSASGDIKITRSIRLPSEPESFTVKITVNGVTQYEEAHKGTDGAVNVTLKGKGQSTVCVYINDVLRQEIPIDFK